jgi:FkbM family methyltransferase
MVSKFKIKLAHFLSLFVPQAVYEQLKKRDTAKQDYAQVYYSQEGEEIILRRFFNYKNEGFFVDIGAHHPIRFSNTYLLYKMGWRGINIDPMPGCMLEFDRFRKMDINIEVGIADNAKELNFYLFSEPALNTFSEEKAQQIINKTNYKLINTIKVKTKTLAEILQKYVKPSIEIDFFSIDVEGFDLKVLKSNDWKIYKPKVIVVESNISDITSLNSCELSIYLENIGYKPFAKTFKSVFYSYVH